MLEAIDSNWLAPAGPALDAFEQELASVTGRRFAVGLSSGTAAQHLALEVAGVGAGDIVLCSTLTFVATANAIHMTGATPFFIDSEAASWNMDPNLLEEALRELRSSGHPVKAVVPVDLYGQCANFTEIEAICSRYEVTMIEDAAEALGGAHRGRPAGAFGQSAILSFNGNKIITASGGGALVTDDERVASRVRHLATQAREPVPHYEHIDRGYNYRLSNVLAALGSAQLATLDDRVERRREINRRYRDELSGIPGLQFMPEAEGNFCTFWLTTILLTPGVAPATTEQLRLRLDAQDIESRPLWKPMHQQPAYESAPRLLSGVADLLFAEGLCIPSGSGMSATDQQRVILAIAQSASACSS